MSAVCCLGNAFYRQSKVFKNSWSTERSTFLLLVPVLAFHIFLQKKKKFHIGFQLFLYGCSKYSLIIYNFCYLRSSSFFTLYFLISFTVSEKVCLLALIFSRSTNNFLCKVRKKISNILKTPVSFLQKFIETIDKYVLKIYQS